MQPPSPSTPLPEIAFPDTVPSPLTAPSREERRAAPRRRIGLSVPAILIFLASTWCLAICAHVPERSAATGLAAAYGLLFLILLPFNRWSCFLVLVAACAAESVLRAWSPIRYNTLHYATFLLLPVAYALVRPRARLSRPLIFWCALILWSAISVFWCKRFDLWLACLTEYVGLAGLALLTRQLATSPRRRQEMGIVFAVTALAAIVTVLVISGVGTGARLGDIEGLNADGVGELASMGMLMLAMSSAESGQRWMFTPARVALYLPLGVALMLTQSRGSMLALTGAALTFSLAQPQLKQRLVAVGVCVALGAGLVLAALQLDPTGMANRWQSTFGKEDLSGATAGRTEIWRTTGYVLRDNWIAGIGIGQFRLAFQDYSSLARTDFRRGVAMQAHNIYVNVVTEGGLVAALLMAGFYLSLWMGALRLPPGKRRAIARAMVVYLILLGFSDDGLAKGCWLEIGLLLVWFGQNRLPQSRRGDRSGAGEGRPWEPE